MDTDAVPLIAERRDAGDPPVWAPQCGEPYHNNRTRVARYYRGFNQGFKR